MADSPYVVTVTAATFESVVIQGSYDRPVLVDFWADWCAPCRMLMPILAKLADELAGRFILAKVNTEEEQALAAQFGIRSLPTVQLFLGGAPVDQFMGALPEPQIREFLERHIPRESDALLSQAGALIGAGRTDQAQDLIERARREDPGNPRLALAEVHLTLARGDIAAAEVLVERLPIELAHDPEVTALRGQLRFAAALDGAPAAEELASRLESDPKDSEARYQLAAQRVLAGDYEAALELLLELVRRDRAYGDDAGRKAMLALFDMLGPGDPLAARYRARMMNALY